jgi:hypothetical protein
MEIVSCTLKPLRKDDDFPPLTNVHDAIFLRVFSRDKFFFQNPCRVARFVFV